MVLIKENLTVNTRSLLLCYFSGKRSTTTFTHSIFWWRIHLKCLHILFEKVFLPFCSHHYHVENKNKTYLKSGKRHPITRICASPMNFVWWVLLWNWFNCEPEKYASCTKFDCYTSPNWMISAHISLLKCWLCCKWLANVRKCLEIALFWIRKRIPNMVCLYLFGIFWNVWRVCNGK